MPKANRIKTSVIIEGIRCVHCGAGVGELCWGSHNVQMLGCHWQRRKDYERARGLRPLRRSKGMTTRFVCPVCGGEHSRADHPQAA